MTGHIDTAAIKSNVTMMTLLERDGHKLKKITDHFVCLCPFHREKSPSCHVWDNHLHCFGCNTNVDAIEYVRKTRSLTFMEAVEFLNGGKPIEPTYRPKVIKKPEPEAPPIDFQGLWNLAFYATHHEDVDKHAEVLGVNPECLLWLGMVNYKKADTWAFPMRDGAGKIIGIRLRTADGKKFAVTGSKQGLFIPVEIPIDRRLFVMEGPTDTAACLSLGFYGIGRPSCNGAVDHVLDFLKRNREVREVVLVTDNDGPGIKGADELRQRLPVRSYQLILPPKDIRRFVQIGGGRGMIESMIHAQMPLEPNL